jgi:hypothetical protein
MARRRHPGAGDPGRRWVRPKLSSKHSQTLAMIFERSTRPDIPWRDIEALFVALGGAVTQGKGSRRRVQIGERKATFHEPHPEQVTDKGAVVDIRRFLLSLEVSP